MRLWLAFLCVACALSEAQSLSLLPPQPEGVCNTPNGEAGKCILPQDCPSIFNILSNPPVPRHLYDSLRESICKRLPNGRPFFCCPDSGVVDVSPPPTTARPSVSTAAPVTIPKPAIIPGLDVCGGKRSVGIKIVGGQVSEVGAWPWLAVLGYGAEDKRHWGCGGTLITSRHVLTAAHCIKAGPLAVVRLGDHDLKIDTETPHQELKVKSKKIHEKFNPKSLENDIAIIELEGEVQYNDKVFPACLPDPSFLGSHNLDVESYQGHIAGWGNLEHRTLTEILTKGTEGLIPDSLMEAEVPFVDEKQCKEIFKVFPDAVIDNRTLCAGFLDGSKDTCQGDSGGPLMAPIWSEPANGKWFLHGIVSFGFNCAEPGYPGVYVRVATFLNWIYENVVV